jgi:hypothetical protein
MSLATVVYVFGGYGGVVAIALGDPWWYQLAPVTWTV